jgi:hypothetical protein
VPHPVVLVFTNLLIAHAEQFSELSLDETEHLLGIRGSECPINWSLDERCLL